MTDEGEVRVRFRRKRIEGTRWRYGHLAKARNRTTLEGHVTIRAENNGGFYVVPVEGVQVRVPGPRGGWKWTPIRDTSILK